MKERTLLSICFIGAIIGIIILYLLSFMITPIEASPSSIDQSMVGRSVFVSGRVANLEHHENGHIFFDIEDEEGYASAVIWKDRVRFLLMSGEDLTKLSNGQAIEVVGDVEMYKGNVQIVI